MRQFTPALRRDFLEGVPLIALLSAELIRQAVPNLAKLERDIGAAIRGGSSRADLWGDPVIRRRLGKVLEALADADYSVTVNLGGAQAFEGTDPPTASAGVSR